MYIYITIQKFGGSKVFFIFLKDVSYFISLMSSIYLIKKCSKNFDIKKKKIFFMWW